MQNYTERDLLSSSLNNQNEDYFDFSPLFADTILSIAPSALVLVAGFLRIGFLWDKKRQVRGSRLRRLKLLLLTLYACLQLSLTICWAKLARIATWSALLATSLSLAGAFAFCVLSYLEHARSIRPSSILLVYLLFSAILDVLRLRSLWNFQPSAAIIDLMILSIVFKVASLALEAIEKTRYLPHEYSTYRPEETSSILNRSIFFWLNSLMMAGARSVLVPDALYKLDAALSAKTLTPTFIASWEHFRHRKVRGGILRALMYELRWQLLRPVFPRLVLLVLTVCQPILIEKLLRYLQHETSKYSPELGRSLIAAYSLTFFGMAVFKGFYWHSQYRLLSMMRGCLVASLNWQVPKLAMQSVQDPRSTLTLMSADIDSIIEGMRDLHEFWANTIQIGLVTYLLTLQLGLASMVPIAITCLATASVTITSKTTGARKKRWMETVEQRVSLTSSILSSMKEVRMKGLSTILAKMTQEVRIKELNFAAKSRKLVLITGILAWTPDLLTPTVTFLVFYVQAQKSGTTFDSARAFTSLALIILLAQQLKRSFTSLPPFIAAFTCLRRIEEILCAEEQKDFRDHISAVSTSPPSHGNNLNGNSRYMAFQRPAVQNAHARRSSHDVAFRITDGCFRWVSERDVLKSINVMFPAAKFSCIIGPVASGKSTLCKALLGETQCSRGRVELMPGIDGIAFCDQTAFLTNQSIRQNIVGLTAFDKQWYDIIVKSVALEEDFVVLPKADQTMVGTDGINLSGGQRHKVALARALYSRHQIVILDDVFSGLDVDSAEHIASHVLGPHGLARKYDLTVILATHTANLLQLADHVIVLSDNGEVVTEGSFPKVRNESRYVQELGIEENRKAKFATKTMPALLSEGSNKPSVPNPDAEAQDKTRQTGDFAVYRFYFRAAGAMTGIVLCLMGVGFSITRNSPTLWLKVWTDAAAEEHSPGKPIYPTVYACIQLLALVFLTGIFYQALLIVATKAGKKLHNISLHTVMNAPLSMFSNTDIGALTNRFSQDMTLIDMQLAFGMLYLPGSTFFMVGQAVVISISSPWVAISFPFILLILYYIQHYYLRTSRQLRLIDIEARSPLYTHFLEMTTGLVTLRAFGWTHHMFNVGQKLLDESQRPQYLLYMIQRWLIFVLDTLIACLATIVAAIAITQRSDSGFTGSALSQLVTFSQSLTFIIIDWTDVETSIGAVGRIKHFSENTSSEHKPIEINELPEDWPTTGKIELANVSARYDETVQNDLALRNLNLIISPGEKIGICGRSGSGKSSTALLLLRMLEITEGSITVDGIDLSTASRNTIRSRFNTLPQHPFFFPGTVRMNLDPTSLHSNTSLFTALEKVGLKAAIINEEAGLGLDSPFKPGTLSHGQRQMFALASAILCKSKIVILDEVTSNVDSATDLLMQKIIREEFSDSTVIAVAHRLNTVADFDRIVVMSAGRFVEIGKPKDLLAKESSLFRRMWKAGNGDDDDNGSGNDIRNHGHAEINGGASASGVVHNSRI